MVHISKKQAHIPDLSQVSGEIEKLIDQLPQVLASSSPKKVKNALGHFVKRIEVDGKAKTATCYLYRYPQVDRSEKVFTGNVMPEVRAGA